MLAKAPSVFIDRRRPLSYTWRSMAVEKCRGTGSKALDGLAFCWKVTLREPRNYGKNVGNSIVMLD